jgi:cellulose synthase/poly-beta-1,6-N-acetylglucosamine synthase-like glycosyltransferase
MMRTIGAVAIGRNEGERLKRCLQALVRQCSAVVYVDSGSTDGSVAFARSIGVDVVELDMTQPFNAARARNAGWRQLMNSLPQTDYVQFVDGDCELVGGWLEQATSALDRSDQIAVVCGRRRERFPNVSIYNRMMDFEWDTPIGNADACGGDSLVRVATLIQSGGMNETVSAGEEPEFCQRLRGLGWRIERIDAEMTLHDADMTRFSQWWRRQRRSGYGGLDVTKRFGVAGFRHELRSARIWTVGWLAATLTMASTAGLLGGGWWFTAFLLIGIGIYVLQIAKLTRRGLRLGLSPWQSLQYGCVLMVSKFAAILGQSLWWLDHRLGRKTRLIEYKSSPSSEVAPNKG